MTFLKSSLKHIAFSVLSVLGGVALGATLVGAATTISTNIQTDGTLSVTGSTTVASQFNAVGGATLGTLTLGGALTYGGVALSNAVTGTGNMVLSVSPTFTGTAILSGATLSGLASTTQLKVGSDQVSTISGMIFGTCTIPSTNTTASSTVQVTCASATGVTTSYKVFVQATSSLPSMYVIQSATSSTGAIEVRILNTGLGTTTAGGMDPTTLNFWAVR